MSDTLRDFVNRASSGAERLFKKNGRMTQIVHYRAGDGHEAVVRVLGSSKDQKAAFIRALLRKVDANRVVLMDQSWMLDRRGKSEPHFSKDELTRFDREGLRNEPERVEVVSFYAEDQSEGQLMAHREIVRPVGRAPYLAALRLPLEERGGIAVSQGRYVGLLPRRTTVQ